MLRSHIDSSVLIWRAAHREPDRTPTCIEHTRPPPVYVLMCVCVCVRVCVCVCVSVFAVRGLSVGLVKFDASAAFSGEPQLTVTPQRERQCVRVCVREGARQCVCVCVRERVL